MLSSFQSLGGSAVWKSVLEKERYLTVKRRLLGCFSTWLLIA